MNSPTPFKILFLCTGNSARSILAEYLTKRIGAGRFESYSAGSNPNGEVNPMTLRILHDRFRIDTSEARSKSWDEFLEQGIDFDFVITVCDDARETCPVWPGQPILAHWSSPDPAGFNGTEDEKERFFFQVAMQIHRRIELLCSLPIEMLDNIRLSEMTRAIGEKERIEHSTT